jgi:hypothetical protein
MWFSCGSELDNRRRDGSSFVCWANSLPSLVMLSLGGQVLMSDPASALGFLQTSLHSFLAAEVVIILSSMFDEPHQ